MASRTQKLYESPHVVSSSRAPKDKSAAPSLVLIHPPMFDIGTSRKLTKSVVVVGRDAPADFIVARGSVSRRHAELRRGQDGSWAVADMGSTNGTYLNNTLIDDGVLTDGDHVQFGDAVFQFVHGTSGIYHQKVAALTVLDGPTGIHNERYFLSHVTREMQKARTQHVDMALILFEVDWFLNLVDDNGALCGDYVLRTIARRAQSHINKNYLFARVGECGFAVFMPHAELDDGLDLAELLRRMVDTESFSFDGSRLEVTISAGVAGSAEGELDAPGLIGEATRQMESAKQNGHNRIAP